LHGFAVPVLRVLDDENHHERHNGRGRVNHQLPGVAEMKRRPKHRPDNNNPDGQSKGGWSSRRAGRGPGESLEEVRVLDWALGTMLFFSFQGSLPGFRPIRI